jgi:hypothetical protein
MDISVAGAKRPRLDWLGSVIICGLVVLAPLGLGGCAGVPAGGIGDEGRTNDGSGGDGSNGGGSDNGGDGSTGGGTTVSTEEVDDSLDRLGVDTSFSRRSDVTNEALPEDYSPIGSSCDVAKTDELFIVGPNLEVAPPVGEPEPLPGKSVFADLVDDDTGVVRFGVTEILPTAPLWEEDNTSGHPGMSASTSGRRTIRSGVGADVDGDGIDEIAVVYLDVAAPAREGQIWIEIIDSGDSSVDSTDVRKLVDQEGVVDLSIAEGDFDGDGQSDLVVGWASRTEAGLHVAYRNDDGSFFTEAVELRQFFQSIENSELSIEVEAGNIDYDNGNEFVAIVNEYGQGTGASSYWIFDDERTAYQALATNDVVIGQDDGTFLSIATDVTLGDIDADRRDEIIFAGLTEFHNSGCESYSHLLLALEDAADPENALTTISAYEYREPYVEPGTGCNSNSHYIRIRQVHVNALDIDGDGIDEIQAARHIYEDFDSAEPWTPAGPEDAPYVMPYDVYLEEGRTSGGTVSDASTTMVVGDFNADGREDIVSYYQWRAKIGVWGLVGPAIETSEFTKYEEIETTFTNGQARVYPMVIPCNVDKDGLALRYSDGEYNFVFTEPIIIAALAAAPCANGIGQNTDACVTAFGQSETQDIGIDGSITVSATTFVSAEAKDPIFGIGAEAEERLTATASFSAGLSYTLEETVEFTTGPLEDTVIFTTVPLDQYVYTVVSHPDPALVGEKVVINMPRSPVTLQVSREFYNANVAEGSLKIGSNIFLHTPGDIDSYPTEGDADALIETGGLGHLGPLGELVDAAGEAIGPIAERLLGNGIKSSRVTSVGQGGGMTTTEIRFSEQNSYRAGAEISYESEFAVSGGGVSVGMGVGGSIGAGLSWGGSNSTIYRGSVGSIDAENFAANGYSFGLFTYIYNYGATSDQQFEVVNYWVEK